MSKQMCSAWNSPQRAVFRHGCGFLLFATRDMEDLQVLIVLMTYDWCWTS